MVWKVPVAVFCSAGTSVSFGVGLAYFFPCKNQQIESIHLLSLELNLQHISNLLHTFHSTSDFMRLAIIRLLDCKQIQLKELVQLACQFVVVNIIMLFCYT